MGSKFEFDETRNAIGVDNLDPEERKRLKQQFESAGGKVLSEREVPKPGAEPDKKGGSGRSAGGGAGSRGKGVGGGAPEVMLPSQMARERRRQESEKKAKSKEELEKVRKRLSGPMAKFSIRLRCFMNGLTPFSQSAVKPKFMSLLALDVKQSLVEFNLLGNDLFYQNPGIGNKIIKSLDGKNPLFMEVLEAAHKLYDQNSFNDLIDFHQSNPQANVPLDSIGSALKELYRKLYLVYPFQETLKRAYTNAIDTYIIESDNKDAASNFETKKKRAIRQIKVVFQTAFPKLFMLLCRLDNTDYPPFSPYLEKVLNISPDDKLGKRKKGDETSLKKEDDEVEEDESAESTEEGSEEKKAEKKKEKKHNPIHDTKEYKWGMKLMSKMPPPELKKKYDAKNEGNLLPLNDKVYLTYLFFSEFDNEYSFVLTTNKIKYNIDYSSGVKIDHKKNLADLYDESRNIIKSFEKYYEAVKELEELKKKKISSNYVEQSKAEEKYKAKADTEGRNLRGMTRQFMEKVNKYMAEFINDMKGEKKIVANMNDEVKFSSEIEGDKKLNGKKVHECIMHAYSYSLTLKERLTSGDLYGGVINLSDEEMLESFGSTFNANPGAETKAATEPAS